MNIKYLVLISSIFFFINGLFAQSVRNGLKAEYFNDTLFQKSVLIRIDRTINFDWGFSSPDDSVAVNVDNFSVRWTGKIIPLYTETYTFYIRSDNGRRLWINNQLIIDKWLNDWDTTYTGTISLTGGQSYDIKLEYFEGNGGANITFEWSSTRQARQIVPRTRLSPNYTPPAGKYINPVLEQNFPDPAIIRGLDGTYYSYATMSGNRYIQISKSSDLIHWSTPLNALPKAPTWGNNSVQCWAPCPIYDSVKKKYFLYYSDENNNGGKCLAVATSNSPAGPFVDMGTPLVCGSGFVNIDPMPFDDPVSGKKLLYWGSGFSPIKVQELDSTRMAFKSGTQWTNLIFANYDGDYDGLVEGAWTMYRNGYYYIFYSGDNCCGSGTHYAVMVARSNNPFGPFERYSKYTSNKSSVILELSSSWVGPGHNSIIADDNGDDWILYHAMTHDDVSSTFRELLIDRIYWENDWPTVKNSKPSFGLTTVPYIKTTGIQDYSNIKPSDINIYPNPVANKAFSISLPQERQAIITIYDICGKEIYKSQAEIFQTKMIDASQIGLGHGVYIVNMKSGNIIATKKIVIY